MGSTLTNLLYHLVFSTKHREPLILPAIQPRLYEYIGGMLRANKGVLIAAGGVDDHVHLLVRWRPDVALSELLRQVKGGSSRWVHDTFPDSGRFGWQDGYSAFTVSQSRVEELQRYFATQAEHHRKRSFKEELLELLRRNNVEFDEQYLWD